MCDENEKWWKSGSVIIPYGIYLTTGQLMTIYENIRTKAHVCWPQLLCGERLHEEPRERVQEFLGVPVYLVMFQNKRASLLDRREESKE